MAWICAVFEKTNHSVWTRIYTIGRIYRI